MTHPFRNVAIVGVHNTLQARQLPGHTSLSISTEAAHGALADAGLAMSDVDGVVGEFAGEMILGSAGGPRSRRITRFGIPMLLDAAALITSGECAVVLVAAGGAGLYTDRSATAPWTRPSNEFVAPYGMFTAAEFALMARRHMIRFGTTHAQMAGAAAAIRNHGAANPQAVFFGKGPVTAADVMASRPIAEPFHLLDCSMTSEGGCAVVMVAADRLTGLDRMPVWIHGAAGDTFGPAYVVAPVFDGGGSGDDAAGWVGRRAARRSLAMAGLTTDDVDVAEFYDPFSFEIIRQLEAFGFCDEGEGGAFVEAGHTAMGGRLPVTTDGGTMSFSHPGINAQQVQRVVRGVQQLRGECPSGQVPGAEVAMCTNGGSGALFCDVMVLGSGRP